MINGPVFEEMSEEEQIQEIGEIIYRRIIVSEDDETARRITGMIIDNDVSALVNSISRYKCLIQKVGECKILLT